MSKRQPLAPTPSQPQSPLSPWSRVKSWFLFSEVILLSRIAAIGGAVTTFVGGMDFSPLWTLFSSGTDFTHKQVFWIGISILGAGVTMELARRRNATMK